jgi:hypothetical protein
MGLQRKSRDPLCPVEMGIRRKSSASRFPRRRPSTPRSPRPQVASLLSGIYQDLQNQYEGIVEQGDHPATFALEACLSIQKKTSPNQLIATRCGSFVRESGWMLLSICAQSATFRDATVKRADHWQALKKIIQENSSSLEMFAKVRGIDWETPLMHTCKPPVGDKIVGIPIGQTMNLQPDHPHLYALRDGVPIRCTYNGQNQININECVYNPKNFPKRHPLTRFREPCIVCGDRKGLCKCDISDVSKALAELVDLGPPMNRAVRTLASIKNGEYLGVYIGRVLPPNTIGGDTSYFFTHGQQNNQRIANAYIDSAVEGNWLRYVNHSCEPNTVAEQHNVGQYNQILYRAIKDIPAFTQVTVSYGPLYFHDFIRCHCGEPTCRWPASPS